MTSIYFIHTYKRQRISHYNNSKTYTIPVDLGFSVDIPFTAKSGIYNHFNEKARTKPGATASLYIA